ncbi:protease complex subunit PrcB family protein [Caldalkalibacillus mannanilyticus]|uniref:protease complex subunit PrcB family protein n=1 Tax=Caldalkalibacillus mannanilyticus TaxID=1418 RepID=UPI000469D28E|nr:protease complex subunit PrcB family protein [Caldalkalibacillus mannanilyticus]
MRKQYPDFIQTELEKIKQQGGLSVVHDQDYTYAVIGLGERSTGGYSIQVLSAEEVQGPTERYILIKAKETKPGPYDMVTQAFTYPVAVHRLPLTPLPIKIEWI